MIMTKEQQIQSYMEKLQISREEAEQLWEDDQEDYIGEEGEEMTAKAKEIRRYEQSAEKKARKPREKKIDAEKVAIIHYLVDRMESRHCCVDEDDDWDFDNICIPNEQKEITFRVGGNEYSLTLTKHRPPKKQGGGNCGCRLMVWHTTFNRENVGSSPINRTQID